MLSDETDGDKVRDEKWCYSRIKIEVGDFVIPHRHCYYYCYCYCVCYYFHCLEGVSQTKSCWSASRVLIEVIAAIICTWAVCTVIVLLCCVLNNHMHLGSMRCDWYDCVLAIVVLYVCVFHLMVLTQRSSQFFKASSFVFNQLTCLVSYYN